MIGRKLIGALALSLWAALGGAAQAATCGIIGSAVAAPAQYDPFNPAGLATTSITLNLTRLNPAGGGKTDVVNFYLKSNSTAADGTQIVPTSVVVVGSVTGLNHNIFYNFNAIPPIVAPTTLDPIAPNNFLKISFTGNNTASDTAAVTFNVTLPAGLNLNASTNLPFDANFACSTTGGGSPTQQIGTLANAVTFPITVLSAASVYYAGTALDFGEIGALSNSDIGTTPKRTADTNYVSVRSSGAYTVDVTSANGYQMVKPGGTTANDKIKYQLKFLGMTRDSTNTTILTRTCTRAGVPIPGQSLYIQGTLQEGGQGKNPSPSYLDTLTVTVTPLVSTNTGIDNCGSYTIP